MNAPMKTEFHATLVSYRDAIDGDIIQVGFEENENDDVFNPTKLYLSISVNYEFGSRIPHAQWFDGIDEDGGKDVVLYCIGENEARIQLENGHLFIISYERIPEVTDRIRSFLARDCREFDA